MSQYLRSMALIIFVSAGMLCGCAAKKEAPQSESKSSIPQDAMHNPIAGERGLTFSHSAYQMKEWDESYAYVKVRNLELLHLADIRNVGQFLEYNDECWISPKVEIEAVGVAGEKVLSRTLNNSEFSSRHQQPACPSETLFFITKQEFNKLRKFYLDNAEYLARTKEAELLESKAAQAERALVAKILGVK